MKEPDRTSYVGRRTELDEVRGLLATAALVTLTGPGGVGKTRLAARAAESAGVDVAWVSLAELREPQLLPETVAAALGLVDRKARSRTDIVIDHLRERRVLLVLDNCEHLIEACARFADEVLGACPGVGVLATSRQSLGMAGERVFPVPPLPVPAPDEPGLADNDAVRLFADRATAVVPTFAVTEDNAADVVRVCAALDGLPLAIELAAVRLRSLSVRQLADRLGQRLALLTQGRRRVSVRHGSFQAVLDWSRELCGPAERLLWARASVFVGGFDLAAAEEVCAGDGLAPADVLDVVDGLIDKSILLREEQRGTVRYRMLETVREYGEDLLRADGDLDRRRRLHRDWCLRLTERAAGEWLSPAQLGWIERMRAEHPNLRAALDFCTVDRVDAAVGLRMVCALRFHWFVFGFEEGRLWCRRMLALAEPSAPHRVEAMWLGALLALLQGSRSVYLAGIDAAEAAASGDELGSAFVRQVRGCKALIDNDADAAALFTDALASFRACGHQGGQLWAQHNLGLALGLAGEPDRARAVLHEAIAEYERRGEVFWRSWALFNLAAVEFLFGDPAAGVDAGRRALRLQHRVGDSAVIVFSLSMVGGCTVALGDFARGTRLLGAATGAMRRMGLHGTDYVAFSPSMRRSMENSGRAIGADARAEAFAGGAELSTADAIDYAIAEPAAPAPRERRDDGPLTARENEIAAMVGKGMTNQQIASALGIARRTAETHVRHILTKLDLGNRTQVAAWVAGRDR